MTIQGGKRQSTAATFLKEAKTRPNLTILTNAHTTNITFEGTKATGITFRHKTAMKTATANKEVLICAGALNSPQLLMLSNGAPPHPTPHTWSGVRPRQGPPQMAPQVGLHIGGAASRPRCA